MKPIFLLTILSVSSLFALSPLEIATNVKQNSSGFESARSVMEMVLIDQAGNESKRVMHSISLENTENSKEDGDKSLMEFKTPLDVKGTKFLSHEKIGKNNNQWLYLPALKRIKRITSKNKSGSFMGSEFSYEDLSSREPLKYTYEKALQEVDLNGTKTYHYERYPKDKHSGYSKQAIWVDANRFVVLKVDYYDKKKELLKTSTFSGYKKIKDTYRISKISMVNHQNKKATTLEYLEDEIHQNLRQKDFSKRALQD